MNLFANFLNIRILNFCNKNREDLKKILYKFKIKLRRNRDLFFEKFNEIVYFVRRLKKNRITNSFSRPIYRNLY